MKTIIYNLKTGILPLFYFTMLFTSCDNFVEVELPNSQLFAPAVFEDMATANAAMTSIYSKIRDNGLLSGTPAGLSHQLGNYADELDYYGDGQNVSIDFYNKDYLRIFSRDVLMKINKDDSSWEAMVPPDVASLIKERRLFGYCHRDEPPIAPGAAQ